MPLVTSPQKRPRCSETDGCSGQVFDLKLEISNQNEAMRQILDVACKNGYALVVDAAYEYSSSKCLRADDTDDPYITTLLFKAIKAGHVDVVKSLIHYGVDVDFTSCLESPLYFAIDLGRGEIVNSLISAGASLEMMNARGARHTALGFACLRNRLSVVKVLIKHKVDINAMDTYGFTPMMLAAAAPGNGEVLVYLIEVGADIDLKAPDGKTAMSVAMQESPHLVEKIRGAMLARSKNCTVDSMDSA